MELTHKQFDWTERIGRGKETEERFVTHLQETYGLHVMQTSQHLYKPTDKMTRHSPDMFVMERAVFVQVKEGRESGQYSNVIAETDSIDACKKLFDMGSRVWAVWEYPDGSWHGNDIQHIRIVGTISDQARKNGSGTPAYKISKASLKTLESLIAEHEQLGLFFDDNKEAADASRN